MQHAYGNRVYTKKIEEALVNKVHNEVEVDKIPKKNTPFKFDLACRNCCNRKRLAANLCSAKVCLDFSSGEFGCGTVRLPRWSGVAADFPAGPALTCCRRIFKFSYFKNISSVRQCAFSQVY